MTYHIKRKEAVRMRESGYSYNLISEKLGISKSTLSLWLSKLPYKPNNIVRKRIGNARAKASEIKSRQKQATYKLAYEMASKDLGSLTDRDMMMLGIGLYVGEGQKKRYGWSD